MGAQILGRSCAVVSFVDEGRKTRGALGFGNDSAVPGPIVRPEYVDNGQAPEHVHNEAVGDGGPIVDVDVEVVAATRVGVQVDHLRVEVTVQIDQRLAHYDDPHLAHGVRDKLLCLLSVVLNDAGHSCVLDGVALPLE